MTTVFDEWLCNDIGSVFIQLFDVALGVWLGRRASLCIFNGTCGHALALEHTGDLYSCDHFVEPDYLLGNIRQTHMLELVTSPQQARFGQVKSTALPKYCRECEVRFMCNGGCPKDRILKTPDGEPGLNFLCEGYRNFFNHIDLYMKMMAMLVRMQRPPAEIMQYADQLLPASGPRGTSHGSRRTPITKRGERSRKSAGL